MERPDSFDIAHPATEITALLGRGTSFEGKLQFEGRVRIDGVFKGEIRSDDTLVIGEGAEVHAEIEVATVVVRGGTVHGDIKARTSLEVFAPGKVIGNIHSPSVFIERGVEFQGSCRMDAIDGKPSRTGLGPSTGSASSSSSGSAGNRGGTGGFPHSATASTSPSPVATSGGTTSSVPVDLS
jgi:cytoskeletal protein CcmA (bactofilin family)